MWTDNGCSCGVWHVGRILTRVIVGADGLTFARATGGNCVRDSTGRLVAKSEEQFRGTIPLPSFARRLQQKDHRIKWFDQQGLQISELHFLTNSPRCNVFMLVEKFLSQFSLGGNVLDQRSGDGRVGGRSKVIALNSRFFSHFPKFQILDARIAFAPNKIFQNSYSKKKVSLEEQISYMVQRLLG